MKNLLTFLLLLPTLLLSQTSVELRAGSHISYPSGTIAAGFTQDINNLNLSATFATHSTQSTNFDLYSFESGYSIKSNDLSLTPIIGISLKNHRGISTSTHLIYGATAAVKTSMFTVLVGYRKFSAIEYVYTGIRIPLIFNRNNKIRFF